MVLMAIIVLSIALVWSPASSARTYQSRPLSAFVGPQPVLINAFGCASVGNCIAIGAYDLSFGAVTVAATESRGRWSPFTSLPGLSAVSPAMGSPSISCFGVDTCAVLMPWLTPHDTIETFVASETLGRWTPLTRLVHQGASSVLGQGMWCSSQGDCVAIATTPVSAVASRLLVATEHRGAWSAVRPVLPAVVVSGRAGTVQVSCSSVQHCLLSAVDPIPTTGNPLVTVAAEVGSSWRSLVITTPGRGEFTVNSLSCLSGGTCLLGGGLISGPGCPGSTSCRITPALATLKNGATATERPVSSVNFGAPNFKGVSQIVGVACSGGGDCYLLDVASISATARVTGVALLRWRRSTLSHVSFAEAQPELPACNTTASQCVVVVRHAGHSLFDMLSSGRVSSITSLSHVGPQVSSCYSGGGCTILVPEKNSSGEYPGGNYLEIVAS